MKLSRFLFLPIILLLISQGLVFAQEKFKQEEFKSIFDDKSLLNGYAETFRGEPKEILLAMIQDDTLTPYKMAAAVRVYKENFCREVFSREKNADLHILLRRLNRTDSSFVQVEIMHTLCLMDRYKYFKSLVPLLIQFLDHYNSTVDEMAYQALEEIIKIGHNRPREARIVFITLRKNFFLNRKHLAKIKEPDIRLKRKLTLTRWAVKVLGTQELNRLPKEVINLL